MLGHPETVVIGAGMVGLNAAIRLKQIHPEERVIVLDRSPLGAGGSTRNAGFACFGSPTEILSDLKTMPESAVVNLVKKRYEGLQLLRSTLGDQAIGLQMTGSYELFTEDDLDAYQSAMASLEKLNALLFPITGEAPFLPVSSESIQQKYGFTGIRAGIANVLEGTIDTGLMMRNLRLKATEMGVEIYGGMEIKGWEETPECVDIIGEEFTIRSQRLLICTNGFLARLLPDLDATPARNLVLVTDPITGLKWDACFHMHEGYIYFRNVGNRLLIGGARHHDAQWHQAEPVPPRVRKVLTDLVGNHLFPKQHVHYSHEWIGYLGVGRTREPLIGQHSDRVSYAGRMGGMGVAIGTAVGWELAELVLGFSDRSAQGHPG